MSLSNAENAVVMYLKEGFSNKDIANNLTITEKTVKFHLTNIFKKYEVKSRAELLVKLTGYHETERDLIVKDIVPSENEKKELTQTEKIKFIDEQFKVGEAVNHLHGMMKSVTKDQVNPATVNAACNCVARINETITTAIQAAKFLNR